MTEISLMHLDALISKATELKKLLTETPEILEYLRLAEKLHGEQAILPTPADRLVRTGEAAKILNVGKKTINHYVSTGELTPLYTAGSSHKKFWLSEVKSVAKQFNK